MCSFCCVLLRCLYVCKCMTRLHNSLEWWQVYSLCTNAFLTTYNPDTYITSQKLMVEQKLTKRFTVLLIRYGQKLVFSVIKVAQVSPPSFPASIFARIWKQKSQTGNQILLQSLNNWKTVKKVQFSSREQRQGLCLILTWRSAMFVVTPTSVANKNSRAGTVAVRLRKPC